MKIIKYTFLSCEVNHGTQENPDMEQIFLEKSIPWNEANEAIAAREACNGEYEIYDDGEPEPEPTQQERISDLEEALELLLSGATE